VRRCRRACEAGQRARAAIDRAGAMAIPSHGRLRDLEC
jgi:hypothetical protein